MCVNLWRELLHRTLTSTHIYFQHVTHSGMCEDECLRGFTIHYFEQHFRGRKKKFMFKPSHMTRALQISRDFDLKCLKGLTLDMFCFILWRFASFFAKLISKDGQTWTADFEWEAKFTTKHSHSKIAPMGQFWGKKNKKTFGQKSTKRLVCQEASSWFSRLLKKYTWGLTRH